MVLENPRSKPQSAPISEETIRALVHAFYARIRKMRFSHRSLPASSARIGARISPKCAISGRP
jgi:hypothetical protein